MLLTKQKRACPMLLIIYTTQTKVSESEGKSLFVSADYLLLVRKSKSFCQFSGCPLQSRSSKENSTKFRLSFSPSTERKQPSDYSNKSDACNGHPNK
jgi:hypothetical protein